MSMGKLRCCKHLVKLVVVVVVTSFSGHGGQAVAKRLSLCRSPVFHKPVRPIGRLYACLLAHEQVRPIGEVDNIKSSLTLATDPPRYASEASAGPKIGPRFTVHAHAILLALLLVQGAPLNAFKAIASVLGVGQKLVNSGVPRKHKCEKHS